MARRFEAVSGETSCTRAAARPAALKPDSADAHEALGEALHGQGKHAAATAAAERAARLAPNSAGAYYVLGLTRAALGERDKALAAHAKLVELKADDRARRLAEYVEKKAPAGK